MRLYESWKVLVYGRRRRRRKPREPLVFPTSPVEWEAAPRPAKRVGRFRRAPPPSRVRARHSGVKSRFERDGDDLEIEPVNTIRYGWTRPIPDKTGDMHLFARNKRKGR